MTNHLAETTIGALFLFAAMTTKEEYVIQAYCGIGGVLAGYLGSTVFPIRGMQLRIRWITNVICACICGPILTTIVARKFPDLPVAQIALVVSGACGVFGVGILKVLKPLLIPILNAFLPPFIAKHLKNDASKDDQHGNADQ